MMNRRTFLNRVLALSMLGVLPPTIAEALVRCSPFSYGWQECESGIDSRIAHVTAAAVGGQHMTQWCWAACIEMVFRYWGYIVPQEIIVRETWGEISNFPADPWQILQNLNTTWRDSRGRRFATVGDQCSATPATASQDLGANMPLILGTLGHTVVLSSLLYRRDFWGNGGVVAAIVRDPWPGAGRRILSAEEWYATDFLVRIRTYPL